MALGLDKGVQDNEGWMSRLCSLTPHKHIPLVVEARDPKSFETLTQGDGENSFCNVALPVAHPDYLTQKVLHPFHPILKQIVMHAYFLLSIAPPITFQWPLLVNKDLLVCQVA